jgi:hypothetical protein
MEKTNFIKLVKKRFGFLFGNDDSIIYTDCQFGNCLVVLQTGGYKIKIIDDRGIVAIKGGTVEAPNDSSNGWYELPLVISFITRGPKQKNFSYGPANHWYDLFSMIDSEEKTIDKQMIRLVKMLDPYWSIISDFFRQEGFQERQKGFDKFREEEIDRRWPLHAKYKRSLRKGE